MFSMRVVCALSLLCASGAASCQTRDENADRCVHARGDLQIGACTALIQSGQETTTNLAVAFNNRGTAYKSKGDYDRAIQDYDQAIKLKPDDAVAFRGRGIVRFDAGAFAAAVDDFSQSLKLTPTDAYSVLWRHLAARHAGTDDTEELSAEAQRASAADWPAPLLKFDLGQMTVEEVMRAVADMDPVKDKGQRCEANFFLGEDDLLHQRRASARTKLMTARDNCPKNFSQYASSLAELKRMGPVVPVQKKPAK